MFRSSHGVAAVSVLLCVASGLRAQDGVSAKAPDAVFELSRLVSCGDDLYGAGAFVSAKAEVTALPPELRSQDCLLRLPSTGSGKVSRMAFGSGCGQAPHWWVADAAIYWTCDDENEWPSEPGATALYQTTIERALENGRYITFFDR